MKSFFKIVLATLIGQIILLFIVFLIGLSAVSGLKKEEKKTISNNSVIYLEFNAVINDQAPSEEAAFFGQLNGDLGAPMGLIDMIDKIDQASKDSRIKGMVMDFSMFGAGFAKAEELHNALLRFKKSGKFLYAYSDYYYNGTYYLASTAGKVFMNPQGEMLFNGLVSDIMFFKGALEKLGVEVQVIKRGKFKGAVEPYIREDLSDENRTQIKSYVNSVFNEMVNDVAESRNLKTDKIKEIADQMLIRKPEDAQTLGLLDQLLYKDELFALVRKNLKIGVDDKIPFVKLNDLELDKKSSDSKIAIVYASGDIVNGEGDPSQVGADRFAKILRKLRNDDEVKAVVLRIDSRGGSALASEIIWRETVLLKKVKPLIVSMSDVAASGGYYIASNADTIVASPQTITGSIGVFGLVPNAKKLMNEKLGITSEYVGTGAYSDFGRIDRALNEKEYDIIDGMVGRVYSTFLQRVSEGRGLSVEMVDSIGQGRVWTGIMAKERGLVDVMGGIDKAIEIAQFKAKLKDYEIVSYPQKRSLIEELLGKFNQEETARIMIQKELGSTYSTYQRIKQISEMNGVQMYMPYDLNIR